MDSTLPPLELAEKTAASLKPGMKIYFIGIGGISMCGLAEMAQKLGYKAAGSDANPNERCRYLESIGITVHAGHAAANIDVFQPDLVVATRAIFSDNPERLRAAECKIPLIERAAFLGALSLHFPKIANIAGTNGKSTTTAMAALMLIESGQNPTVHLGAELIEFQTTVHTGGNNLFVSEACEFGRGFYHYASTTLAVLNIVHDHIDTYKTLDDMIDAFAIFLTNLVSGNTLILPTGERTIEIMLDRFEELRPGLLEQLDLFTCGKEGTTLRGRAPDLCYKNLTYDDGLPVFDVTLEDKLYGRFRLRVPGEFNVQNALAAIAIAHKNGGTADAAKNVLKTFRGAEGRFTYTGKFNGARVYADYAHHPSSVRVTVDAARHIPAKTLHICFQPLTHSRVRGFFDDFVDALKDIRPIYISEIYDDRERDSSISSKDICTEINRRGGHALYFPTNDDLETHIRPLIGPGDVLLIMGVDLRQVADRLTKRQSHLKEVSD